MTFNEILEEIIDKRREEEEDNAKRISIAKELGEAEAVKAVRAKWEAEDIERLIELYVKLDSFKPMISKYYETLKETVNSLEKKLGVNGSFKDPAGIIYQVQEATGKFVSFDKYTVVRTKKPDEVRGSLAQSKALEFGFGEEVGKTLWLKGNVI